MARYWSNSQIDAVTPPRVLDARGRAFLRSLNHLVAQKSLSDFYIKDAETCPASALPALIAEYSMEEFIAPGLAEHVVRRILKHAWFLKEAKGYDDGVRLGLDLLGMRATIEHWHDVRPMREVNTHEITFYIGEQLFSGGNSFLGEREKLAAYRMIDATKRWSQQSSVKVGFSIDANLVVRSGVRARQRSCETQVLRAKSHQTGSSMRLWGRVRVTQQSDATHQLSARPLRAACTTSAPVRTGLRVRNRSQASQVFRLPVIRAQSDTALPVASALRVTQISHQTIHMQVRSA